MLVAYDGRAVLGDFSMGCAAPADADFDAWAAGTCAAGTYMYMAPEMVRGRAYGARADVWSMGLVLVEALGLSEGPYFKAFSLERIMHEHACGLPLDFSRFTVEEGMEELEYVYWELLGAVRPRQRAFWESDSG